MADCQFKSEYRILANESDIRTEWEEYDWEAIQIVRI